MDLELPWRLARDLPSYTQLNLTWCSITLGHKMSLPVGGTFNHRSTWLKGAVVSHLATRCLCLEGTSDPRSTWPKGEVISHLTTRCCCLGVHLTTGQPDQSSNSLGHKMSLPGKGQVDILFDSQSASCNWPANQPSAQMSICQTSGWSHSWCRDNWGPNHIRPQSRVPALPLFPLGAVTYLNKARQVTNKLCSTLYTIGSTYRDHLQFCIYVT